MDENNKILLKLENISKSFAKVENDEVLVKRETGEGYEVLAAKMPCVITVTKPSFSPRYPTIKSKMAANRATINTLTAADIPVDAERIGLKGSPTKIAKASDKVAKLYSSSEAGRRCCKRR